MEGEWKRNTQELGEAGTSWVTWGLQCMVRNLNFILVVLESSKESKTEALASPPTPDQSYKLPACQLSIFS